MLTPWPLQLAGAQYSSPLLAAVKAEGTGHLPYFRLLAIHAYSNYFV